MGWPAGIRCRSREARRRHPPGTPPSAPFEVSPDAAALEDLRRFQRFYYPLGQWRTWAYPRSLLLEARVLDRLGNRDEARAVLAKLEDLLSQADPDFPLLAEARALRRKLGRGQPVAATAPDPGGRTLERRRSMAAKKKTPKKRRRLSNEGPVGRGPQRPAVKPGTPNPCKLRVQAGAADGAPIVAALLQSTPASRSSRCTS